MDKLEEIGVKPEANDVTQTIQEVGGLEFVYTKNIDEISINDEIASVKGDIFILAIIKHNIRVAKENLGYVNYYT
ncbi:hypothetical protein MUN88_11335 [Gracilibacillus caseinilyticus]|uniref:Uncharacterized protein n=1 Tax=Gracilibacillus caseinilyticus TaxID=2932256 RepID=A0ABY4ERI5_9BACI|nr:hypothetical protein [Gracilibacillus caseinilyticus]UOQ46696.1 hypothetical protein MUN88_11335 [Gracilibacillus caseinilyticus]